jgi:hypothetical protein
MPVLLDRSDPMASIRRSALRRTALAAAVALAVSACGGDPSVEEPEEPVASPTETPTEDPEEPEEPAEPVDDGGAADDDAADGGTTDDPADDVDPSEPDAGPTADPALLEDPCGPHEDRTDEAFIEVVAPVAEQQVAGDAVDLVGCSNVFEANVQWSLYDGDGRELDTGFTTAECGTGCVGAFEESVSLEAAAGEPFAELHVYAEDASGAEDRLYLTAIPLVLG